MPYREANKKNLEPKAFQKPKLHKNPFFLSYEELFIKNTMAFEIPHDSLNFMTIHSLMWLIAFQCVAFHIPHVSLGLHYMEFIT